MAAERGILGAGALGFGEPHGSENGFVCSDEEKITFENEPGIGLDTEKCVFCIDKNNQVCNAFQNSGLTTVKPATTMKKIALLTACSAALAAALNAQTPTTVTTDPVGFVSITVKGNSDATIAVPLSRTAEYKGTIASIAGNTISVNGTPGWTANQFVFNGTTQLKTYAVQLASGSKEGMIAKITANTTTSITVQLDSGDDLTGVLTGASGDQIDIMPYWTPATLFSVAPAVGFQIAGFEASDVGVNFGASELYVYAGSNNWEDGINGGDAPHAPLRFGAALVARNSSATDFAATFVGSVPMSTMRLRFATRANNTAQDQYFGYMSPIPEAFASATNANALSFPVQVGDTIQGFDNTVTGINKGADELYTWNGSAWEDGINGGNVTPGVQGLKPGFGYIFQKAPTATATSVLWVHTPAYLQ